MLIELQEPFKSKWRKGYKLFDNTINRYKVVLYNSETDILNISYARYLMGVFLGYEVPAHLEVDHINNNPLDDRIENYQLLTPEQNRLKQAWWYSAMIVQWTIIPCSYCQGLMYITESDLKSRTTDNICCSVSCARKYAFNISGVSRNNPNPPIILSDEDLDKIRQYKQLNKSARETSRCLNISRHVLNKYWNSV